MKKIMVSLIALGCIVQIKAMDNINASKKRTYSEFSADKMSLEYILNSLGSGENDQEIHEVQEPLRGKETRVRKYICDYEGCGRKFVSDTTLERHQKTHAKEWPYACTYDGCGKSFANRYSLEKHAIIHEKEKSHLWQVERGSFVCTYEGCGKSFASRYNLEKHATIHAKEKLYIWHVEGRQFVCDHAGCEKFFTTKYNLNRHKKKIHNEY